MQYAGAVNRLQCAGDLARVPERRRGLERPHEPLSQTAGAEIFHREVRVIVGDAEIEDPHDVAMVDASDDLVLLQKSVEQPAAAGVGHVAQDLQREPLGSILRLREIYRRQVARVQLRDDAAFVRTVQHSVVCQHHAGRIQAIDLQLGADGGNQPLVLDSILREEVRGAGLQRIHGQEFVALGRE